MNKQMLREKRENPGDVTGPSKRDESDKMNYEGTEAKQIKELSQNLSSTADQEGDRGEKLTLGRQSTTFTGRADFREKAGRRQSYNRAELGRGKSLKQTPIMSSCYSIGIVFSTFLATHATNTLKQMYVEGSQNVILLYFTYNHNYNIAIDS